MPNATKRDPTAVSVEQRTEGIVVLKGDLKVFTVHPRAFQPNLKDQASAEALKSAQGLANQLSATKKVQSKPGHLRQS